MSPESSQDGSQPLDPPRAGYPEEGRTYYLLGRVEDV